jgi:hypothetical protein
MNSQSNSYRVQMSSHFAISLQRTRRLLEPSPRPPASYGSLPIWWGDAASQREFDADVLVPAMGKEAFWIGLEPIDDRIASALRIGVETAGSKGLVDAVTGEAWSTRPSAKPQNYLVSPPQRSLYGITNEPGWARQFVPADGAVGDVTRLTLIHASLRRIPKHLPPREPSPLLHDGDWQPPHEPHQAPFAAGAYVPQILATDPYGLAQWHFAAGRSLTLAFVPRDVFARRSGIPALEPLDPSKTYRGWRLP